MKGIEIPREILHLHHLTTTRALQKALADIVITGDGKTATAVASDGMGLIAVSWPEREKFTFKLPGALAKKILPFCRADNDKQKDELRISSDETMTTASVARITIRRNTRAVISSVTMSAAFCQGTYPDWKRIMKAKKPVREKQVIGFKAETAAKIFSTVGRIVGKQDGIKCEFTAANEPMRLTATGNSDFTITGLLMPVEMDLT